MINWFPSPINANSSTPLRFSLWIVTREGASTGWSEEFKTSVSPVFLGWKSHSCNCHSQNKARKSNKQVEWEHMFAQQVGVEQSNFWFTKWTPFRVIWIRKYKEMIPCHCPTNPAPTAAKTQTPTVFSDAEFGVLKNLLKPLQYSQQYGQKEKCLFTLHYWQRLFHVNWKRQGMTFLCNREWHWSVGYFSPCFTRSLSAGNIIV